MSDFILKMAMYWADSCSRVIYQLSEISCYWTRKIIAM